ncbi:MAG TPA: SAM-dependent DNA methyltransferase [Desulfobacteraceae bacterium]|nr:SAM-dependent DNA methyltransferase [Desulfobacteraceae bacterium]
MSTLDKSLRHKLERTVREAREVAEAAAIATLGELAVREASPYPHLTEEERALRRALRAHARQLGNGRTAKGEQEIDRLVEEVAYEHWHRMLFARFLAENNLLMYPDPDEPVPVTLDECEDLAADEGAANGWELAARFAARMLPQIFRLDSPVFKLVLPPEYQQKLERLVADLPLEVFTASDSLGWVYQFWQAKRKDEVNASEVKIGARELPAVTQLFTEPYMVSFLLDNSLGAWWAARRLTETDLKNAQSEEELRRKASIPGVPLEYLRFVQKEDGTWTPAAGTFDGWPEQLADLKTLDPCCGSGHFLVATFLMLVPMRMEVDGLSAREAVDRVLFENIHGLEIDRRCVELAAFALALSAWKYPNAGGYRILAEFKVACSGLSISGKMEEWLALAGDNTNLRISLEEIYKQFEDAPILGSLINPEASMVWGSLFELKWEELEPLLNKALAGGKDFEKAEIRVVARGIAQAAELLSNKYNLVLTNVPYLKRGKQIKLLQLFGERNYPRSKHELATIFWERCHDFCCPEGIVGVVMPHYWMFHGRSLDLRKDTIAKISLLAIAILGTGAFETISGEVVNVGLFISGKYKPTNMTVISGMDVSTQFSTNYKAKGLISSEIISIYQSAQITNPDSRVILGNVGESRLVSRVAETAGGMQSFDKPRFILSFPEIQSECLCIQGWIYLQSTIKKSRFYGGRENVFLWERGEGQLAAYMDALAKQGYKSGVWRAGIQVWGKQGILFKLMGEKLECTIYSGQAFENTTGVLVPHSCDLLPALWSYCVSYEYSKAVRQIDKKLAVTNGNLSKVPFDLDYWAKVAEEKYPNGLPKPYSDDPTQWIFHGHPCGSVVWDEEKKWTAHGALRTDDAALQVAVPRLLGYRWPSELDANMELADEQREWVKRCEALLPYADDDGIVCIPPVRGEASAADRLLNLLVAAYGDAWSHDTLARLLKNADHAGKTLETWLRDKFFSQHCKLFHHRPFIWQIWDGLRDGFSVLVNYHKLDGKKLETLIYTYLGDWISRQKQDIASGVDGAQERLDAAESLKKKLELILEGESPYDIFVRWKPIEKQPIGWDPDLNDGVRLNIRPFMTVGDVQKKGAGVLRDKPNINWNTDRGKDVESAPWYHLFKGDRINDHHLTLDEKRKARLENRK